jgi:hypothetical protein
VTVVAGGFLFVSGRPGVAGEGFEAASGVLIYRMNHF